MFAADKAAGGETAAVDEVEEDPVNSEANTHFNTGAVAGASAGAAGLLVIAVGAGTAIRYRKKKAQEERSRLLKAETVLDIGYVRTAHGNTIKSCSL